ncbi:MAG: sigma-70 family RNA polymerase sigma factor, partial [Oscillospiraceae bacterium]|nr:sigma-70 family RNA polymerase sigma factor [Oscillospiraceae bacterium]
MLDSEKLKNLFYYCLKRTGNRETAEDLSGDIVLEILTMTNRGYKPENFNAWMWTVARAKYAGWAKSKNVSSKNIAGNDVSDYSHISSDENIETDLIRKEEISSLCRELSIMSREYREITVAYYIENKKISDISKAVKLPEGTIKRKLSESRKYLKEGINMTRTYGKRSYSPDNIEFTISTRNAQDKVPHN